MKSKTRELLQTVGYALAMVLCIALINGGIQGGASVLLQNGFRSRWWLGVVFAVAGIYLARLTAKLLKNSVKKRRKKSRPRVGQDGGAVDQNTPCSGKRKGSMKDADYRQQKQSEYGETCWPQRNGTER